VDTLYTFEIDLDRVHLFDPESGLRIQPSPPQRPETLRATLEEELDEGLAETFPVFDPVAVTEPARSRPGQA
jgi:hypothetical protein